MWEGQRTQGDNFWEVQVGEGRDGWVSTQCGRGGSSGGGVGVGEEGSIPLSSGVLGNGLTEDSGMT